MGKDVEGLTSNVRDEDIIMHHVPESPGVSLGSRLSKEGSMVIVYVIRKDNVAGECWSFCCTCLQTVFSSTVLGEKSSEVGQPRGAGCNLHGC